MADLQELLSRLTSSTSSSRPQNSAAGTTAYHEPSVSSPLASPSPSGLQPRHASAIMSPNMPASSTQTPVTDNRSASLLNLLKFSQPSATPSQTTPAKSPRASAEASQSPAFGSARESLSSVGRGQPESASDLVSSFMRQPSATSLHSPTVASPVTTTHAGNAGSSTGSSSQAYLLNLLNQRKPAQASRASSSISVHADQTLPSIERIPSGERLPADGTFSQIPPIERKASSPLRVFGAEGPGQTNGFDPPAAAVKPRDGIFSYVNPFEQLHASSPRQRTPVPAARRPSPSRNPATLRVVDAEEETWSDPKRQAHGEEEAPAKETVSEAVTEVGERVDKEVEKVLAEVTGEPFVATQEIRSAVKQVAAEIQHDLKDDQVRRNVEGVIGKPMTDALDQAAEELAVDTGGDSWESDSDGPTPVYNFPMKPFVSINVLSILAIEGEFPKGTHTPMARLKKEFDQNDRSLVAANERYFTYVSPKNGGFRVVRQSDGAHKQLFADSSERLVNIALSASAKPMPEMDTVLGTGVDGSVFWTLLSSDPNEQFSDNLDERSFVFPPHPAQDDNVSGGQLKTRARKSSRNANYFAVGRGKAIHIVWPNVASTSEYTNKKSRVCDSEKYLRQRSLKISTGKAGKDFSFSQCDTVIVSLDKTGKMRFWDVRPLIAPSNGEPGKLEPVEVKSPIMTLPTTTPTSKSWPTSVMFLDKEKPHNKGIALRYLLVGMKQNHTLQLWDLCLGKAVQEIALPHRSESDGICSVAYHPQSGIISVGHPTRNTVYFIHLSAPRYALSPMSQAKFLEKTVNKDPSLPKIESTAIMTGIREFSFARYGELRSFEILPDPVSVSGDSESGALFDLYVMHSKGVCTLTIKRETLGWGPENNVLNPVDAVKIEVIEVSELKSIEAPEAPESVVNGEPSSKKGKPVKEASPAVVKREKEVGSVKKGADAVAAPTLEAKQDVSRATSVNGSENADPKSDKKKKKKAAGAEAQAASTATEVTKITPGSKDQAPTYAKAAANRALSPSPLATAQTSSGDAMAQPKSAAAVGATSSVSEQSLKRLEDNMTATLSRLFNEELDSLYRKFDEDKRVQDAAGAAKQDAVLRLVSSTLTDNVEKSLTRIVSSSVQSMLLPALTSVIGAGIDGRMQEVKNALVTEHRTTVSNAVAASLRDQTFQNQLGSQVAQQVVAHIDSHISNAIGKSITPAVTSSMTNVVQQVVGDLEQRMAARFQQEDARRHSDAQKLDQLTTMVGSLTENLHNSMMTQAQLANTVIELQRQLSGAATHQHTASTASETPRHEQPAQAPPPKTAEELEADEIRDALSAGHIEGAVSKWVQSTRQVELFSDVLSRCDPRYLDALSPLVTLSAAAALTQPLEPDLGQRLAWLERLLEVMRPHDAEIRELVPKIMEIISTRLQTLYMQLGEAENRHPMLKKIVQIHARAIALRNLAANG